MGAYLSEPVTEKLSSDEANAKLECGASSMQGWRVTQEDAHNTILDYDTNTSLFAVYDGHGGAEVATYCSQKLPDYIKNTEAYKKGELEKALEEAFLGFDATVASKEIMAILKDMAGEMYPPHQSDGEESDDENVGNLYQEAQLPLQEVLAKYDNKLAGVHRARLSEAVVPLSPCLRGKRGEEAGGSGASASSSSPAESAGSGAGAAAGAAVGSSAAGAAAAAGGNGAARDEGVSSTNEHENKEANGEVSTSEPDNTKSMEVDKPTVPTPDSSEDNHLQPEQSESKTISNGAECNGDVTESRQEEDISSSNGSGGKGKAKDKSPVSSSDKPVPDRPKKRKLSRMAAMVYETLLRRAHDDDEGDNDDEDDENDETFQGDNCHSSDEEVNGAEDDESNCEEDEDIEEEEEEADSSDADSDEEVSGREEPGMDSGCTAVVALLRDNELYVANAGDSRCIICREGRAIDMSVDHKPEDEPELERITKAGGKVSADGRINSGLNLSRAIGDHSYKQNAALGAREQMITALPDVKRLRVEPARDQFLVLACDGIWNFMSSQDVCDFILPRLQEGRERLSQIAEEMFDHCLAPSTVGDGTGCDNMTAIIVRFKDGAVADVAHAQAQAHSRAKRAADQPAGQDCKRAKLTDDAAVTSSV